MMDLKINIKNINVNSISNLGSLNIGKVFFAHNKSQLIRLPKEHYQEKEFNQEEIDAEE
ncbi:hypothetical protein [Gracilibacillus lacisalsi]|uniref:hypothetical protein n=1 Tax=Gracilibacillus lacisalsi TaxID=393087 RepID=UPI00036092B4|nr:hypothetical protein [Gracilibacillus lacisalsi]